MNTLELTDLRRSDVDDIFRSVNDLLPDIRLRRREIEQGRRLPRDLVNSMAETGMFRLGVPRTMGGEQARPADLMAAIEAVATADGSAGWCAMIGVANGTSAGFLPDAGAREMFADPSAPSAGIAAPSGAAVRVEGGVQVSGRWSFASGITHCEWLWAGCLVMEDGKPRMTPRGPEIIHVAIPVADVQVHDTWYVTGLCGTASNDFSVSDVFVPDRRIFALLDPSGHRPEPLYRLPALGTFASQVACVSLGIARAALDEVMELAQTKVPSLNSVVLAEKPVAQVEIARAEASLTAARAYLYHAVEDLWQTASAGSEPTPRQLANLRMASVHAVETGASVSRTANVLAGGGSIYLTSSLQRHARDAEAITHHFTVAPHVWEDAGRVLLKRPPSVPAF